MTESTWDIASLVLIGCAEALIVGVACIASAYIAIVAYDMATREEGE